MLKIITLRKAALKLSDDQLRDGLAVLKSTGAIASYKLRKGEISLTLDHVRAEMVLEHLVGVEPHNPENMPKNTRGKRD